MKLYYLNGENAGKVEDFQQDSVSIGRETDNTVQLLVGGVSRYHAKLTREPSGFWSIRDLGSTNGTRVNGELITTTQVLHDNDVFIIGDHQFRIITGSIPGKMQNTMPILQHQSRPSEVPVPEPAAPVFEFRPGLSPEAPPPPPPPPISATQPQVKPPEPQEQPPRDDKASKPVIGMDLFKRSGASAADPGAPEKKKSSLKGNLIFALILLIMLGVGGGLIYNMVKHDAAGDAAGNPVKKKSSKAEIPFFFFVERQLVNPATKNIFKCKIHGELGYDERVTEKDAEGVRKPVKRFFVTVTLDDLENDRHFTEKFGVDQEIPEEKILALQKNLQKSGFMSIEQDDSDIAGGNPNYEWIVIGFGDKMKDIIFYDGAGDSNTYFREAFQLIRQFVDEDVSNYNGISFTNTKKEIMQQANEAFTAAQRADENYINDPRDLPRAIQNYSRAEKLYMQFRKKSAEYNTVVERLAKLREIHKNKYLEGIKRITQAQEIGDLDTAIAECETYMAYFPAGSKEYEKLRGQKLAIENYRRKTMEGK